MTIDSDLRLQPTDQATVGEDGVSTIVIEWKGLYADAKATDDTISIGDDLPTNSAGDGYTPSATLYAGYKVASHSIRRGNGDTAVLSVTCKKADATSTSQDGTSAVPFRTVYSVKSVRNDVSVLAYCSDSPSGPNRAAVERWMREPDAKLAANFKYTDTDGSVVDMTDDPLLKNTVPLIRKIKKGVERVIRFYPQLTIKRQYYAPPPDTFDKLSFIDTPPTPSGEKTLAPSGISTLISAHQWLKVQDDCDEQQNGTWMRTESWIGILKASDPNGSPWDPDLYGTNRWQMPHDAADPNQQDSNDPE
jgi:hypothetical protein